MTKPDWEGFSRAIMEEWYEHYDMEASERFDLAVKFGVLKEIEGGFDPESHHNNPCDAEAGDPWFEIAGATT
jgi:hypothetical protein